MTEQLHLSSGDCWCIPQEDDPGVWVHADPPFPSDDPYIDWIEAREAKRDLAAAERTVREQEERATASEAERDRMHRLADEQHAKLTAALVDLAAAERTVREQREALERVGEIHRPVTEQLMDLDAGPDGEDVPIDVEVCADCWSRIYADGCDDESVDPDVIWPCPTARAAALSDIGEA